MPTRALLLLLFLGVACGRPGPIPVDSDVTFGAHLTHNVIVVDRLPGGGTGVITPASGLRLTSTPRFDLDREDKTIATLFLTAPATVDTRAASGDGATTGSVQPTYEDQAVRLTLRPADGPAFRSDVFARDQPGGGPLVLTRVVQSVIDVRGVYKASLRDDRGATAGWLRVRIGPYDQAPRIYDGVVPSTIGAALASAAALALNSEIDWIEDHALNVYRGSGGGPLRESIPMGK